VPPQAQRGAGLSRGGSPRGYAATVGRRSLLWSLDVGLVAVLSLAVDVGPRVVDGRGHVAWATFHAARQGARPTSLAEAVRRAGRTAVRALERTAPLPYGVEAARVALGLARSAEAEEPSAALDVYSALRTEFDLLEASPIRRIGTRELSEEVHRLEAAAKARERREDAGP
jgi:hypothetical protein